jgi:hypothetical protein
MSNCIFPSVQYIFHHLQIIPGARQLYWAPAAAAGQHRPARHSPADPTATAQPAGPAAAGSARSTEPVFPG